MTLSFFEKQTSTNFFGGKFENVCWEQWTVSIFKCKEETREEGERRERGGREEGERRERGGREEGARRGRGGDEEQARRRLGESEGTVRVMRTAGK